MQSFILGSIIFLCLIIVISCIYINSSVYGIDKMDGMGGVNRISYFQNVPPYITQSLVINIYSTKEDYPKYEYLFKGALNNNIMIAKNGIFVLVPRTTTGIPIRVFKNALKTKFSIIANGIEQEIQECDFIATIV